MKRASSARREDSAAESVRARYEAHGVARYYAGQGADYRNPHEPQLAAILRESLLAWQLDLSEPLDLACGAGEATRVLQSLGAGNVTGIDPYTAVAYHRQTGLAAEPWTFEQIAAGALAGRRFSLIVCSYALHLLEPSRLPGLLLPLAELSGTLVVATPHKRPELRPDWGWQLQEERERERVRVRLYRRDATLQPNA